MVSTDSRLDSKIRKRASEGLEAMTTEHLLAAGLSADYADECAGFVRAFDVDDHDPALLRREREDFQERMRVLFLQGSILQRPTDGDTVTSIVLDQCRNARTFIYGNGQVKVFRAKDAVRKIRPVMTSMQVVVDAMLAPVPLP
jgi:hypothetical protein